MNTSSWLIVAGLVLIFYLGSGIISELKQLRSVLTERVGSLAEAAWRIRDEITLMNKRHDI